MSKLEALVLDGLMSDLIVQKQRKSLTEALRQQLQETENRHLELLERRIHQNALLSTDVHQETYDKKELNAQTKPVGMRRSISTYSMALVKDTSPHVRWTETPNSTSSAWVHCSVTASKTQQCERSTLSKTTQMRKEEEAEAECQKKFCAHPVPSHVMQPLYQEMMELQKKERKQGLEQRKNFLLSIQKPFTFQEREKEKREKLIALLNQISPEQENKAAAVRKPPRKVEKDPLHSKLKAGEEFGRTVHAQTTMLVNSSAPCMPKLSTAKRTRKEKLGFLDEKPSFQPKIIQQIPDFRRLHKALQTEVLRKSQSRDVTKCQPFKLRTSALPERQRKMSPKKDQEPKLGHLSRSKSLGALTSLSTDTLPTYITDAVRQRSMAIRNSLELRDSKNQEHEEWLRKYQTRSQAMKKTVALHAKLLDPHSSLKEVHDDKLKLHTMADQQRMREYMTELQHMKARVSERPYLFEQVKQRNAKALAEQTYRDKLRKAGFMEQFVEEKGAATEETSYSSRSEDDANENDQRRENDIHRREGNLDDGEKIEDVEEESVKSKGEERP
ncbi:protein FAM161B [Pleuronectes platessa]|nr:protein FAM161B [Pleuronectes platessa]